MPSTRCCRSCPRCHDCPVVLAARARSRRAPAGGRDIAATPGIALLIDEVFAGMSARTLPEPVLRTLEALDDARRRRAMPAGMAS
jgi:hypothetical protein